MLCVCCAVLRVRQETGEIFSAVACGLRGHIPDLEWSYEQVGAAQWAVRREWVVRVRGARAGGGCQDRAMRCARERAVGESRWREPLESHSLRACAGHVKNVSANCVCLVCLVCLVRPRSRI